MQLVPSGEVRETETPNGVMRTLASPTLGGSAGSLWTVRMHAGAQGPGHAFAQEVIWSLTRGAATVQVGGTETALVAGDTVVLPAGEIRRFVAGPDGFSAVVCTPEPSAATRDDGTDAGVPPWVS